MHDLSMLSADLPAVYALHLSRPLSLLLYSISMIQAHDSVGTLGTAPVRSSRSHMRTSWSAAPVPLGVSNQSLHSSTLAEPRLASLIR